jgi:hypothetical protein
MRMSANTVRATGILAAAFLVYTGKVPYIEAFWAVFFFLVFF